MAEHHYREQQQFFDCYLLNYFWQHLPEWQSMRVLEVGCAEAGVLSRMAELGLQVQGLELEAHRVKMAQQFNPAIKVMVGDIADPVLPQKISERFDLIIMREVLEHVPNRRVTFANLNQLLTPGGYLYVTFPPRFSPFGGHQQLGQSILRFLPWLQLWPNCLIRALGRLVAEKENIINFVIQNYDEGITIKQFEQHSDSYFHPIRKEFFLIRPIYQLRFNIKIRKFPNIPLLREFFVTGCECLLQKKPLVT